MWLRMFHTYWRVSKQQYAGAPVLFMMVIAQALIQFPPEMDENWLRNGLVN